MGKYIVKRVLQFIPVFLGVTLILFALQNIVPGDPIKLIGGDKALSPEVELQLRVRYHLVQTDEDGNAILDENGDPVQTSLVDRYLYYMNGLLHGDLGNSYQRKLPVTEIFAQKYPYTVKLAACAIVLEAIMGIGAGIISAVKRYSFWDILVTLTTSILVAVPAFWLGMENAPPVASLRMTPKNSCSNIPSQKAGTATRIDVVSVTKISQKE